MASPIGGLDDELGGEDVRELGSVAVAPTSGLLLRVVVVTTGKQVSEDELRHIHFLLLMNLHGHPIPIVVHADAIFLHVDDDLNGVHLGVALLVVRGVDKDLVEDLIETGHEGDGPVNHAIRLVDPEGLCVLLDGADIGVGSEEDVLELAFLLVHFFDGLGGGRSGGGHGLHVGGVAGL